MFRSLLFTATCLSMLAGPAFGMDARALFAEGERAFEAGQYDDALQLFQRARAAGSTGPSSYYNIGVCQFRLADYAAAEATFAALAAEFPALRELAEYNRGLALRAESRTGEAQLAFERARTSSDEKIAALATAQLRDLGMTPSAGEPSWRGYVSGGLGYDDNVALVDELLLASTQSASSPLVETIGVVTHDFGATPLRIDLSGYFVRYSDARQFDQSAVRLALVTDRRVGEWTLSAGPTLARSTLDGDGFEELVGADLRIRRGIGGGFSFDARFVYDDADAGDARFAYLEGSRRQLRFAVQHSGVARVRGGYDLERNDRMNASVSPSRQRWSVSYQRPLSSTWTADARLAHRDSRYRDAALPRDERLIEVSFAAWRDLDIGWTLGGEYRWSDNDSTVSAYSYDSQRVSFSLGRSF